MHGSPDRSGISQDDRRTPAFLLAQRTGRAGRDIPDIVTGFTNAGPHGYPLGDLSAALPGGLVLRKFPKNKKALCPFIHKMGPLCTCWQAFHDGPGVAGKDGQVRKVFMTGRTFPDSRCSPGTGRQRFRMVPGLPDIQRLQKTSGNRRQSKNEPAYLA